MGQAMLPSSPSIGLVELGIIVLIVSAVLCALLFFAGRAAIRRAVIRFAEIAAMFSLIVGIVSGALVGLQWGSLFEMPQDNADQLVPILGLIIGALVSAMSLGLLLSPIFLLIEIAENTRRKAT